MRVLVEEWGGCDLYFGEMLDASTTLSGGPYESWYRDSEPCPEKFILQLVGANPDTLIQAAELLKNHPSKGLDLNMGCSAPQIFRTGAGVAWMQNPQGAAQLIKTIRTVLPRHKTLSVKLRLGEDDDGERLVEYAQGLQEAGLDFLTLHPRLRKQTWSRPARWEFVSLLKSRLRIPVMGNGDIRDWESYLACKSQHPADGYMLGRGLMAQPWLCKVLRMKETDLEAKLFVDRERVGLRYLELLELHQPQAFWHSRARRFFGSYLLGYQFGARTAAQIQNSHSYLALVEVVGSFLARNREEGMKEV